MFAWLAAAVAPEASSLMRPVVLPSCVFALVVRVAAALVDLKVRAPVKSCETAGVQLPFIVTFMFPDIRGPLPTRADVEVSVNVLVVGPVLVIVLRAGF